MMKCRKWNRRITQQSHVQVGTTWIFNKIVIKSKMSRAWGDCLKKKTNWANEARDPPIHPPTPIASLSEFFISALVVSPSLANFSPSLPCHEPHSGQVGEGIAVVVEQPYLGDCSQKQTFYPLFYVIHRVRGCRQLEIKVWKLGQRTRGGLLAFQESFPLVLYVYCPLWNTNTHIHCGDTKIINVWFLQENRRRAEEEKARRQAREQREKEINEKRQAEVWNEPLSFKQTVNH